MIPSAEGFADGGQGHIGQLAAQIHGYLTRSGDGLGALFAVHILDGGIKVFSGDFLNIIRVNVVLPGDEQIGQGFPGKIEIDGFAVKFGVGDHSGQRALKLPDIGMNVVGDKAHDVVGDVLGVGFGLLAQNGHPRFEIRRGNVGD